MDVYQQVYLINASDPVNAVQNQANLVAPLALTATTTEILTLRGQIFGGTTTNYSSLNGALVVVYDLNGVALGSATTDSGGYYTVVFNGQRNTSYNVVASAPNYNATYGPVTFSNSSFAALSLLLTNASSIPIIMGQVTDTNGQGIAGAEVYVSSSNSSVLVTTMNDGSFIAYDSFTTGTNYTITASKMGYTSNSTTLTYPADNTSVKVTLILDSTNENLTTIIGKIIIAGSSPETVITDAYVGLFLINSSGTEQLISSQKTNAAGLYAFTNVVGGNQYRIRAVKIVELT